MDLIKIGTFIAEKRKQKELTQQELADKLHLSNRTISKWECGKGIPDSSIMMELCEALDISVNELLAGEELYGDAYRAKAEENVMALIKEPDTKQRKALFSFLGSILAELLIFFFIVFCCYLNIMSGAQVLDYVDLPSILIVTGAACIMLVASGMCRDFLYAVRISLWHVEDISKTDAKRAIYAVVTVMLTAFLAGGILTVASVINTFVTTTSANEGAMHAALAVGLLGILYAIVICILLLPILGRTFKAINFT